MVKTTLTPGAEEIRAITDLTMKYDNRMKRSRIMYTAIGIMSLAFIALCKFWDMTACMVIFVVIASFAFFMSVTGLKSMFEKAMWKFDSTKVERTYTIGETGVSVDSELGTGNYTWDMFLAWGNIRNYIYLLVSSRQVILVDRDRLSDDELEEIRSHLSKHVRFVA